MSLLVLSAWDTGIVKHSEQADGKHRLGTAIPATIQGARLQDDG
jgi:hypothetical protein